MATSDTAADWRSGHLGAVGASANRAEPAPLPILNSSCLRKKLCCRAPALLRQADVALFHASRRSMQCALKESKTVLTSAGCGGGMMEVPQCSHPCRQADWYRHHLHM